MPSPGAWWPFTSDDYRVERRDAFNRLGDHLHRITKGDGARVVQLAPKVRAAGVV